MSATKKRDLAWMDQARCRDMDYDEAMRLFFPDKGKNFREARRVCHGSPATETDRAVPPCPVLDECLTYALSFEPEGVDGIWAGTTPSERRNMTRPPKPPKPPVVRSYANLDRLGDLVNLVSRVNRGADKVNP